jgi:carbamoyltransferase
LREGTGCRNIALTGGVALNSVVNGKLLSSKIFDQIYLPSAPGDEGIAIGCAMYGFQVFVIVLFLF